MVSKTLVGNFMGHWMGEWVLSSWLKDNWDLALGYCPNFFIMARGWMVFTMCINEDVKKLRASCWKWGLIVIFLKPWTPFFDLC